MSLSEVEVLLCNIPEDVRKALLKEYSDLEIRFVKGDWGPAELNGGRFAEALLRYLEWKQKGSFTPVGVQLNRSRIISATENDATLPDGIRFHLRRCADLLMDFRNKRDVAHLGNVADVNEMDTRLVIRLSAWALSEIIREECGAKPAKIQKLIDRMSSTHLPLIEEIDGDQIVVATNLKSDEKALVALYHNFPEPVNIEELMLAACYKNKSRFPSVLITHESNGRIYMKDGKVFLTRKGASWIEKNITLDLEI